MTERLAAEPGVREGAPIAVVGLACRLPGAPSPEAFWRLLRDGRDAVTDAPPDRWPPDRLSELAESMPGLRRGGFLERIDEFDADFFSISPKEAAV
ncbi:MAG: beta-ketoacyl synthase N-terminal-like domain-containing protein, partial [Gaiellaceae bacterium]